MAVPLPLLRHPAAALFLALAGGDLVSGNNVGTCTRLDSGQAPEGYCERNPDSASCCGAGCRICQIACEDRNCRWTVNAELAQAAAEEEAAAMANDSGRSVALYVIFGFVTTSVVLTCCCLSFCYCFTCCTSPSSSSSSHMVKIETGKPFTVKPLPSKSPLKNATKGNKPQIPMDSLRSQNNFQTVVVRCGQCAMEVVLGTTNTGACRFTCPNCGAVNEFNVGGFAKAEDLELPIEYPPYWVSKSEKDRRFDMEANDLKAGVQALFDRTWKNQWTRDRGKASCVQRFEVVMVQRNENPKIWAGYYRLREQFRTNLAGNELEPFNVKTSEDYQESDEARAFIARGGLYSDVNEYYLFHGTKPSAAKTICDTDFAMKKAGSNAGTLYGPGLYFAEACSKADEYATDDKDGIFAGLYGILICRVVCGRLNYNDDVTPPVQQLVDSVVSDHTHHSILGDREKCRGTYREFIVFDRDQVYPEYVVIYRRVEEK